MVKAADRLQEVGEYYFSRKLEEIALLNQSGERVISLGIGSPDLSPSEQTVDSCVKGLSQPGAHGYSSYRSSLELRRAFAEFYDRHYDVRVRPESEVLPLLGSKEGIFYTTLAFTNPGDQVLVPNPGYLAYSSAAKLAGAEVLHYDLKAESGWYPDFEALQSKMSKRVKLMWINYPHMPTGAPASEGLLRECLEFAVKNDILLCHDNPYSMVLNRTKPLSLLRFDSGFKHSLELNSLSKSFNMAGWRVGAVLSSAEVINQIVKVKSNIDSGMFLPIQQAAVSALANSSVWHEQRNAIYRQRKAKVLELLSELGCVVQSDQVGLFVWAKCPAQESQKFVDSTLNKYRILLTPGVIFGSQGEGYVRASLCASVETIELATQRVRGRG